ncbi:tetratricopeptide repeat protein 25 isoform X2 [Xenopus tropicalis]|uniref:Outer dynein arm-docking complex subunit 4 n=1 Tax=Xenopus tropicalis TaxID=8364 RepID=A0A8J1J0Q0_XENTR|nr:tetratricopeptide repeat protein 25 isoform X2 [Xenopus tropicalis]
MAEETEGEQAPQSTFATYMAEGEQLYHKAEYKKAKDSFTAALHLQPEDKNCLVARSKCFLKLGDPECALKDAETSLQIEKDFFKGLYQKAEALYSMGDFEFALVHYHRGYKLRPEFQGFRLGIQKAQEAIENSVGTPASVKLQNKADLQFISRQEESKKAKQKAQVKVQKKDTKQQKKVDPERSQKTARQLLGELYSDKEYLESLLRDEALVNGNTRSGVKLHDLIINGILYLDTRTEFWRQQKPIYARERDRKIMQQKWKRDKNTPADPSQYIVKSLEEIDQLLSSGKAEESYKKAQLVLKKVERWTSVDVHNREELTGSLHSCIGNAQMDMGQIEAALQSHKKDLAIAEKYKLPEAKSRALDNIGRVYARIGKFSDAIKVWEEKIPLASSSLEKTWLYHEIGRCYLELERTAEAKDYGEKSQQEADAAEDIEWQLNACVLLAQAEVKLKHYQSAITSFENALERARLLHNKDAEQAILTALEDARQGLEEQQEADDSAHENDKLMTEGNTASKEEDVHAESSEEDVHAENSEEDVHAESSEEDVHAESSKEDES